MIRSGRFLLSVIFALLSIAVPELANAQSPTTQSITDPRGRFTIDFPGDWHAVKLEGGMVAVLGVATAQAGPNPASVNVLVEELPRPISPQTYATLSEQMPSIVFHNYTAMEEGAATIATIAGLPAYYRYFTWQPDTGRVLYQVQVYFTVGRRGFVVTGST